MDEEVFVVGGFVGSLLGNNLAYELVDCCVCKAVLAVGEGTMEHREQGAKTICINCVIKNGKMGRETDIRITDKTLEEVRIVTKNTGLTREDVLNTAKEVWGIGN